jgi:hypothetical protein
MKVFAVVLIVSAIWLVLASIREGRGRAASVVGGSDVWMIEQHDTVVLLGHQAAFPAGHPLARLSDATPPPRA